MLHIGLDLHKHFSWLAVVNDAGEVVERQTLRHDDRAALTEYFRKLAGRAIVTIEATRNWYWLYELLEELGVDVRGETGTQYLTQFGRGTLNVEARQAQGSRGVS
jgi:hypothetical protein